jgi:hypothetical protein
MRIYPTTVVGFVAQVGASLTIDGAVGRQNLGTSHAMNGWTLLARDETALSRLSPVVAHTGADLCGGMSAAGES